MSPTAEEPEDQYPEVIIGPVEMAGVWANGFRVTRSEHEVTLDFARFDHAMPPPGQGIIVARVAFSPLMLSQLMDALELEWKAFANVPEEVPNGGTGDASDTTEGT